MKITIDDVNKTIEIRDENVNIDKLLEFLKERNINLKDYSLLGTDIEKVIEHIPYYHASSCSFSYPVIENSISYRDDMEEYNPNDDLGIFN